MKWFRQKVQVRVPFNQNFLKITSLMSGKIKVLLDDKSFRDLKILRKNHWPVRRNQLTKSKYPGSY
jgi:hypothetical protein